MKTCPRYWCEKSLVVAVEGPEGEWSATVEKPFARIGSHPSSEVVLPGPQVARRGFYLHATDEGVFCVDLLHPTAAERVEHGWLHPGQIIRLGPYELTARLATDTAAGPRCDTVVEPPADLDAKGTVAPPFPRLTVSIGGRKAAQRRLRRRLTVLGRAKAATMRLMGSYISATHCVMYWGRNTLWVIDLLSANGTVFDGQNVEAVEFPLKSSLMLGNVELTFASMAEERRSPRKERQSLAQAIAANTGEFREEGDELFQRVTNRLIKIGTVKRRRRLLRLSLIGAAVLLTVTVAGLLTWHFWVDLPVRNLIDTILHNRPADWSE